MRRAIRAGLFILVFSFSLFGQTVIENPEKPLSKNAGRILKLKEELRITDEDDRFYFKMPRSLKTAHDGTMFVVDYRKLLKFTKEGQFQKNLCRKGQGPGEILSEFVGFDIGEDEIYVVDYMSSKLVIIDFEGNLKDELKSDNGFGGAFLGKTSRGFYFVKSHWPHERKTSRFYDLRNVVCLVSEDGKNVEEVYEFFNKMFLIASSEGGGGMQWDLSHFAFGEKHLYINPQREYFILLLDLESHNFIKTFRREYQRVKYNMKEWEKNFPASQFFQN